MHPLRKGVHVVKKTLSTGEVKKYVYAYRGGPQIAALPLHGDVEATVKDYIASSRGRVVKALINACRKRSIEKGLPLGISEEWIHDCLYQQGDICSITGLPFDYSSASIEGFFKNPNRPSIDRLDNARGYEPDNVRIILHSLNVAINEWGLEYYKMVAKSVLKQSA